MSVLPGYRIQQCIYQGNRSTISRAVRTKDDLSVIIKQLNAQQPSANELGLFLNEYELLSSLDISGVIKPITQEQNEQVIATVFHDHGGISLRELINENTYDWYEWLPIAVRLTQLIGRIHDAQIIHKQIAYSGPP